MASFARRWSPATAWSVDDASTFAAQKEFKLLQLLSTDEKAFATARRLGLFSPKSKQQLPQTAKSDVDDAATSARRRANAASAPPAVPNSRQRRSAARSARRHAQVQVQVYRTAIAVLYICRLRRRCRLWANLADLDSLESVSVHEDSGGAPSSSLALVQEMSSLKRADRPASSSSGVSSASSCTAALHGGFYHAQTPPVLLQPGTQRKQPRKATPAPPYAGRM